ncbi:glycosyltransferase family 39 protein [bacterium]|nr:glycosyltransferase family 39 protein [bacterium]
MVGSKRTSRKHAPRAEQKPDARAAARPAPRFWPDLAVQAGIFLLAIAIYYPALHGAFLWDDETSIGGNPLMRQQGGFWSIWTSFGAIPLEGHFWPMTYTALWLGFQLWGENAASYHMLNFVLYGAIGVQIYRLMRRLRLPGAWIGALLFTLHPVHAESVAWIISIKDLLATLFSLLTVEFFLNHMERAGWKWIVWAGLCGAAAILSKTTPATLPIALAILVWYRDGRIDGRAWKAIAVLACVIWAITAFDIRVAQGLEAPMSSAPPFALRLAQSGWAFWFYLSKLLFPVGLSPIYPFWNIHPASIAAWLPLLAILPLTFALWIFRGRIGRGPLACWLFYGITLGPALGIMHIEFLNSTPAADRYQFMASLGPLAGIGALAAGVIQRHPRRKYVLYAPVAAVLIALASMTWHQSKFYRNMEALFSHALEIAPDSTAAKSNMGYVYLQKGKYSEAEGLLREVLGADPTNWPAATHLGLVLLYQNKVREAVGVYSNAVEHGCNNADVMSNLAWTLATTADDAVYDPERALELANRCLALPGAIDPRYLASKAAALAALGRFDEAVQIAKQALQLARDSNATKLIATLNRVIPMFEKHQPCVISAPDPGVKKN